MRLLTTLPLIVWMVVLALALGLVGGLDAEGLVHAFNKGFGRALGEFALILLPSFTIAAALSRYDMSAASRVTVVASPFAAAGMVCPDTAYAALSPAAAGRKLSMAFGAYAGFRLLFPAGPLIVATALGVASAKLFVFGLALLVPVWLAGLVWARRFEDKVAARAPGALGDIEAPTAGRRELMRGVTPFVVLAALLVVGGVAEFGAWPLVDFITQPKGALITAAVVALIEQPVEARRECLDSAVRRTGSLLLVIGAASAFGGVLTSVIPVAELVPSQAGIMGLLTLFVLTVAFKLMQGSSMATFAAVTPVAAPLVLAAGIDPVAAVFAICLGTFVTMLPNESFYWLVRRDALEEMSEGRVVAMLASGASLQAVVGLTTLLLLVWVGVF
jgi:GntP family gluconate:H+ symporter